MRALVYDGPGRVAVREVDDPAPGPGEVLVEVEAAGICGTDHHLVAGDLGVAPGTIPGHEIAGRVVAVGPDRGADPGGRGAGAPTVGSRVVLYGQVVCGVCDACVAGRPNICRRPVGIGTARPGGFAERVAVPVSCALALPDGVDAGIGAVATDAVATPFHAVTAVARLEPGETVVVIGCGGLGLHAVLLARAFGAGRIVAVDPSGDARDLAVAYGADDVVDPAAHDDPGRALRVAARGATAAFEMVGTAETVELALSALAPGGRVVVVGIGNDRPRLPPLVRLAGAEQQVRGSFGSTPTEIRTVLSLIAAGRLDVSRSVGRRVSLDDAVPLLSEPSLPARTVVVPGPDGRGAGTTTTTGATATVHTSVTTTARSTSMSTSTSSATSSTSASTSSKSTTGATGATGEAATATGGDRRAR